MLDIVVNPKSSIKSENKFHLDGQIEGPDQMISGFIILDSSRVQREILLLTSWFGNENLRKDFMSQPLYDESTRDVLCTKHEIVRLTHTPTNSVSYGKNYDNSDYNLWQALKILKEKTKHNKRYNP